MSPQTAEEYALGVLRRHRDSMTRPDFQTIADDAALSAREVQALWEKLLAGRTPKPLDRPRVPPVTSHSPSSAKPAGPVEAPASWLKAKDHPSALIRRKYNNAVQAIAALEAALAADSEREKLRAKRARLEAALAQVRRELAGEARETAPCPDCGHVIGTTLQAIAVHRARSKKHKEPVS